MRISDWSSDVCSSDLEARELVAGYWVWEVKNMDEAIAWAKRCPNPMPGPSELEIRPFYEIEDFGDAVTPEVAESEQRLRDPDRKSVVSGKSVSGREDIGGRGILKKKNRTNKQH